MQIRFWGTRGSLPVAASGAAVREKIKQALLLADGRRFEDATAADRFIDQALDFPTRHGYGGDSSCVEIIAGPAATICDMGSGLRRYGRQVLAEHGTAPREYHVFMSHPHWDHIMGLPFFTPAYIPGNTIRIYGGHRVEQMQTAFVKQQSPPNFPVHWDQMGADIDFVNLAVDTWHEIAGLRVKLMRQTHHGGSFGYRFEKDGRAVVYATDSEHKQQDDGQAGAVGAFFDRADLVIFDAMYSLADMVTVKEDWGHSSNIIGVDLCLQAKVKHLCLFHHEPAYSDEMIHQVLLDTRRYAELVGEGQHLEISTAYDDLLIPL